MEYLIVWFVVYSDEDRINAVSDIGFVSQQKAIELAERKAKKFGYKQLEKNILTWTSPNASSFIKVIRKRIDTNQ